MRPIVFFLIVLSPLALKARPPENDEAAAKKARAVAISAPRPDYPYSARRNKITGTGVAVLHVDRVTGLVTSAEMAPSTGHAVLDNAALSAFRRWRFQPGTVRMARLPITFAQATTFDPSRRFAFRGVVRAVDLAAGTITVTGARGSDTIRVAPHTQLRKAGHSVALRDIAVSDYVEGKATLQPPQFTALAQTITVTSPRAKR